MKGEFSMDPQDRLALDGALKRVLRAQAAIASLAEDGVVMTMTQGSQAPWNGHLERLTSARTESDDALDALEALHRSLISPGTTG